MSELAAALICLAGAAPSTRQSGKHKAVTFRWALSKQLRDAVCDFADGSRHASPWAAKVYADARASGLPLPPGLPQADSGPFFECAPGAIDLSGEIVWIDSDPPD